jgi:hypothetical protein
MATATLNIKSAPANPSRRSPTSSLTLKLNPELMQTLTEMTNLQLAKAASPRDVEEYSAGLIETSVAQYRLQKCQIERMQKTNDKTAAPDGPDDSRSRSLSEDNQNRVIVCLLSKMKVREVSTRFHIGDSTVRRIAKKRMPSPETIQTILFLNDRAHDGSGACIGGIQAIAEKCHVPEAIVSAVLQNQQPCAHRRVGRNYRPEAQRNLHHLSAKQAERAEE